MSFNSVARWNAIPLERPTEDTSKKRPRSSQGEEDSGDDVHIVSRSPSPQLMDVDADNVHLYDEHRDVRGVAREIITMETKIKSTNKGFAMLAKMGWTEGQPLGLSGEGRVDPVPFTVKQDSTGLGKVTQEIRMIETVVSQRRELDSERMQRETEEQRKLRESAVAQKIAVQAEITNALKPFYCEVCDKQFKNVAQFDEHSNSYGHHHRVRLRDMQTNHPLRQGGKEEADRRKEKERKREEKELRRIAKAAGVKIGVPSSSSSIVDTIASSANSNSLSGTADGSAAPASKKAGGWAKVTSEALPNPSVNRWTTSTPPVTGAPGLPPTNGGYDTIPSLPSTQAGTPLSSVASRSSFSGHYQTPSPKGGWSAVAPSGKETPSDQTAKSSPTPTSRGGWATVIDSRSESSSAPPPQPPRPEAVNVDEISHRQVVKPSSPSLAKAADQSRGSWQQFQKHRGSGRR